MLRSPILSQRLLRRAGIAVLPFILAIVLFAPSTMGGDVLAAADIPMAGGAPYPQPAPGTVPANPLQFDAAYVFEPDGLLVRAAERELRLPTWTPLLAEGTPLLASQQSAPLFPLNWLGVVFPYWRSLAWIAVLKLGLAALGTFLFARALGRSRWSSLLAGIAFAFGSYMIDWLEHPHSNVYILLGWLLLGVEALCRRARVRDAGYVAVLVGLATLGGQPESTLLVISAAAAWLLYRLLASSAPIPARVWRLALAAAGCVAGLGIGAVMLLPFMELLHLAPGYTRMAGPLPRSSLYSLFFPEWWGRPTTGGQAAGPANFPERTIYIGVLPLILAVAGCFGRRPRRDHLMLIVGALVSLVVVLRPGPIGTVLDHAPGLRQTDLNRYLIITSFAGALLAGFGLDALLEATPTQRRRIASVAVALVVAPAIAFVAVHSSWLHGFAPAAHRLLDRNLLLTGTELPLASLLRWLALGLLTLAVIAVLWRWPRARVGLGAALVLTSLDLVLAGWGYNNSITKREAQPPTPAAISVMRTITDGGGRVSMVPNIAARWGLEQANSHEDPYVGRSQRLATALGATEDGYLDFPGNESRTPRLLRLLGVKAVVLPAGSFMNGTFTSAPVLDGDPVAYNGTDGVVVRIPYALPDAFVSYRWRPSSSEAQSMSMMVNGNSRTDEDDPVIESSSPSPAGPAPAATPAEVLAHSDTSETIAVEARAAGQLVVQSSYYPGWQATVDGRKIRISAADGAFESVPVPAGAHTIRLSYHPRSVRDGAIITVVSLLLTALALIFGAGALPASAQRWRAAKRVEPRVDSPRMPVGS